MSTVYLRQARSYDRNRVLPATVSCAIASEILSVLPGDAPRLLELGVGTGRIALPLVAQGAHLTGVDIDPAMLMVLRSKLGGLSDKVRLLDSDACDLPFDDQTFQAVIAVHLWPMVEDLGLALNEAARVLAVDGRIFEGWESSNADNPELRIQRLWADEVLNLGHLVERGTHLASLRSSLAHWKQLGFRSTERTLAKWTVRRSPSEVLEALTDGISSFSRKVPEKIRFLAAGRVGLELQRLYPDPDGVIDSEWAFHLRTTVRGHRIEE
jgi:ubiquinone/menaquinone biosynthesis C-methylase UbiE